MLFLQDLLKVLREEMSRQKAFRVSEVYQMPYEIFRIDFETFQTIFLAFSPWGKGAYGETLAMGIFKVIKKTNKYFIVNFKNSIRRTPYKVLN